MRIQNMYAYKNTLYNLHHDTNLIAKLNVSPKAKQFPFIKYFYERCYGCF